MRFDLVAAALVLGTLAQAQDKAAPVTKPDISLPKGESLAPGFGFAPMLQMAVAVILVVVALKFLLPKLMPMLSRRMTTGLNSSIRIEESAAFAGGNLYVVTARDRTLLVAIGSQGATCLADLTPNAQEPDKKAFFEMVDEAMKAPKPQAAPARAAVELDPEIARERLERLKRLAS